MINKDINKKYKLIILITLLSILILSYIILIVYNFKSLKKFEEVILPGIFIEDIDMSNNSFKNSKDKLNYYKKHILSKKVKLKVNSKEYVYSLDELGLNLDINNTINSIMDYQNKIAYSKKIKFANNRSKKKFNVVYKINEKKLNEFLNTLKVKVDISAVDGYFDDSDGVKYIKGSNGFSLNVLKSIDNIKKFFNKPLDNKMVIELVGELVNSNSNDNYTLIDTMTSSFVTKFNAWEGTRPINLRTGLNYINGAVIEPGEIFSFYKYAGPYNKSGYVFYYEFVGNGVCQIATTVYDAALLGGLEIVKRYPHAKQSVYVEGGLDATVASYSSGWHVDFQFKNTYKYPIYIKAYETLGEAHVEFWSNSKAKDGKTYSTESVKIGAKGYTTYLHTFKNGVEIDKSQITTTWYSE